MSSRRIEFAVFLLLWCSRLFPVTAMDSSAEIITLEEATELAKKSSPSIENLEVVDYNVSSFSSEKQGYLSDQKLLSVVVRAKGADVVKETLTFFVKSLGSSANDYTKMLFREESKFYRDVVPEMFSNATFEKFLPESYLVKDKVIVLENLKARGYKVVKREFAVVHLRSALSALASYHAASMLLEQRLGKPLDQVYPGFFKEKTFINDAGGYSWKWLLTGIEVAQLISEKLKLNSSLIPEAYELMLEKMKPRAEEKNVLCHSDLWTNNIMFATNASGAEPKCVLVDYQSVTYTSYVIDVLQLIYLNAPGELRRKIEGELLAIYHEKLMKTLSKNNYGAVDDITREKFLEVVEDKRICGLITATQFFPIALLNDRLADEYSKDPDKLEQYSYTSRKDFVSNAMASDKVYEARLEEIVKELVEHMENRKPRGDTTV